MSEIEIKPTTFARGVPKEQHNGFFGIEEQLLEKIGVGEKILAVVEFVVEDDITKQGKGVRYPVMAITHIEPVFDEDGIAQAKAVLDAAHKERTGADQLDFDTEGETGE